MVIEDDVAAFGNVAQDPLTRDEDYADDEAIFAHDPVSHDEDDAMVLTPLLVEEGR